MHLNETEGQVPYFQNVDQHSSCYESALMNVGVL